MKIKKRTKKVIAMLLALTMILSVYGFTTVANEGNQLRATPTRVDTPSTPGILDLPIAMFGVFGDTMDRGKIVAQVSTGTTTAHGGVFLSWRYFPSESTGPNEEGTGMAGTDFVIYRNLVRITPDPITDSTNFFDPDGTLTDSYIVVTVDGPRYISRTEPTNPLPMAPQAGGTAGTGANVASRGYYLPIDLERPAAVTVPHNNFPGQTQTLHYYPNEVKVGILDDSGQYSFVVEWITGNPDVIQGSNQGPVIYRAYALDGRMLWEVNLGWNIRPGQHYSVPMLYDFDGDGIYELMVKTAPGTRDGRGNYITMSQASIDAGYTHADRFQATDGALWRQAERLIRNLPPTNAGGTAATALTPDAVNAASPAVVAEAAALIEEGTRFQTLVEWFMGWMDHPEVIGRSYHGNPSGNVAPSWLPTEDPAARPGDGVRVGWWVQPPQVMLGMYQQGWTCPLTGETAQVNGAMYRFGGPYQTGIGLLHLGPAGMNAATQRRAPGWNQERFNRLNALPKCPVEFRRHFADGIPREVAVDLTWQMLQNSFARDNGSPVNNQRNYGGSWGVVNWNGYIQRGPEYMSVFCGRTGAELGTTPFSVPRTDMGQMWNDFTFFRFEPDNRVERHQGAVAYLDGRGETASSIHVRGYYSRLTVSRYDWDGEVLTGETIADTGFEVLPNPFNARPRQADGTFAFNGWTHNNIHGSPGRMTQAFNPNYPLLFCFERGSATPCADNCYRTCFTLQGQQSMNVIDVDGDGYDEINVGGAMINSDGSLRWSAWYTYFTPGSQQLVPGGGRQKIGHGDWMVTGFYHPDQERVLTWSSHEGSMLDSALTCADTGEVLFFDQPTAGTVANSSWAANRDTQRGIAGDFVGSLAGWSFFNNRGIWHSPLGNNTQGGHWWFNHLTETVLRDRPAQWRGLQIPGSANIDNQLFWNADLSTAVASSGGGGQISGAVRNQAGNYTVQRVLTAAGNQGLHWGQAAFIADVLGDWREEFGLLANVGTGGFTGATAQHQLRIYFNTDITEHRLFSLQTDRRYRVEAARYNTGYNIATVPGFYLGRDMNFDNYWSIYQAQITEDFNPFTTILPPRVPVLEWFEDYEHNSVAELQWGFGGGTRVPSPNNRDATMAQTIVAQTRGANSDPASARVGRYNATGAGDRQGRLNFVEPIETDDRATLSFDWFPNAVAAQSRYGQLAVQSNNHFNSLNYINLLVVPAGQLPSGLAPGLYFVTGTTENVAVPALNLTSDNFLTGTVNAWLRVEMEFDFMARTIDLKLTNIATGDVVAQRTRLPMADEDYIANQITGLQFFTGRVGTTGNVGWESFLDNFHVRVYDDPNARPLNVLPFGVPQNVVYSPVTHDTVTISWTPMDADEFHIYRRRATDAGNSLTRIATVTDGFRYVDTNLEGPFYFYTVRAYLDGEVSEHTLEAFIQLQVDPYDGVDDFTLISGFDTSQAAGFGNRIRVGDLNGDGRMDILMANTLPMARNWAGGFPNWIPTAGNTPGHFYNSLGDGMNPRVIFSLTAMDIEGNILWQRSADEDFAGFSGYSREIGTGADEPVQIDDVTGDGSMNVVLVANPGIYVPTAPAWINSVPPATIAHPDFNMPTNYVNRFYQTTGDIFYILCGQTGDVALDALGNPMAMPFSQLTDGAGRPLTAAPRLAGGPNAAGRNNSNNRDELHDHITLADLDGRGVRQHVIMSARYGHTTAFEMINRDGEFVMRFMWQFHTTAGGNPTAAFQGLPQVLAPTPGDGSPHYPLAAPIFRERGDNRDWVINNWEVLNPETGVPLWRMENNVHRTTRAPHSWDPGIIVNRGAHMDSIWVADLLGTGEYAIVVGVDAASPAVVAWSVDGDFLWSNFCPTEAQSANPAWFRTDAPGMMSFGLDRRQRGAWPSGHDGLFFLDSAGYTVFQEESNFMGWMTTALSVNNWTGTYAPLAFGFNRNYHAIEAVMGGHAPPELLDNRLPASFFDGYFNMLFQLPELVDWTALRWMPGNFMGDARDEFVSFSDRGHIFVFANGEQDIYDGITGRGRLQHANLMNWTRYNVGYASTNFEDREAATPSYTRVGNSIEITLVPIIFAESYNLYLNGEPVRTFNSQTDNLRHTMNVSDSEIYQFTVTATERAPGGDARTTRHSVPLVINRHLGEVGFTAEQVAVGTGIPRPTGIRITFDEPVTGLVAEDIIVSSFVGERYGRVNVGSLRGEGDTYVLEIDEILEEGYVRIFIANFGSHFVTTGPQLVDIAAEFICRADLRAVLSDAQDLDRDNFSAANWRLFVAAQTQAQNIYNGANSTQAEIDNAVNTLRNLVNRQIQL